MYEQQVNKGAEFGEKTGELVNDWATAQSKFVIKDVDGNDKTASVQFGLKGNRLVGGVGRGDVLMFFDSFSLFPLLPHLEWSKLI